MGFLLYVRNLPPRILLTAAWPRIVLRAVFWVLVGKVVNGSVGVEFLYVGLTTVTLTQSGIISMSDVTVEDKWMGTYTRLLGTLVPIQRVFFARSIAHFVASLLEFFLVVTIVGLVTGQVGLMVALLALVPIYIVIALSCSAAGLACASFCVGKRAQVTIYNGFSLLIELCSGAMIPTGKVAVFDAIGQVLPVTHGVAAIRRALDGRSWAEELFLELVVLGAWLVLAYWLFGAQARRSQRTGYDAYS